MMAKTCIPILVLLSWTTLLSVADSCDNAKEIQELRAELNSLKAAVGSKVGFSASFGTKAGVHNGPSGSTTIVFKNVFINTGNAYSTTTGIFTAPLKGAYQFTFTTFGYTSSFTSGAILVKNGVLQVSTYEFKNNDSNDSTSNTVILPLIAGDRVNIIRWLHGRVYDNSNHHTTFSGFLLYPL